MSPLASNAKEEIAQIAMVSLIIFISFGTSNYICAIKSCILCYKLCMWCMQLSKPEIPLQSENGKYLQTDMKSMSRRGSDVPHPENMKNNSSLGRDSSSAMKLQSRVRKVPTNLCCPYSTTKKLLGWDVRNCPDMFPAAV